MDLGVTTGSPLPQTPASSALCTDNSLLTHQFVAMGCCPTPFVSPLSNLPHQSLTFTFILALTITQRFSMGLRSGLFGGHNSTSIFLFYTKYYLVFPAVCAGDPSCINHFPFFLTVPKNVFNVSTRCRSPRPIGTSISGSAQSNKDASLTMIFVGSFESRGPARASSASPCELR